ncbi:MAG: hypothetical protein P1U56_22150 [Saprospiraceae bacterium]|nr:hypothetical protein [Saprospiraceae bacterium]
MKKWKRILVFVLSTIIMINVEAQEISPSKKNNHSSNVEKSKKPLPKYLQRAKYYSETRGLDDPHAPTNYAAYKTNMHKIEKKKYKTINTSSTRTSSGQWNSDGPANFDDYTSIGRVNRIHFHPTDLNTIYVATAGGGLWYSPSHGIEWFPLTDDLPNMNLSGVAIDHYDSDVLYILTGDGDGIGGGAFNNFGFGKYSTGVLKSTDHGVSWKKTGLTFKETDNVRGFNIWMDPLNAGILFVASSMGIHRTSNYGVTWNLVLEANIYEVHTKPDDNSILYAVGNQNFYKSLDNGYSWDITAVIPPIDSVISRMTISTCENDPERVYLYAAPRNDSLGIHRGVFLSDDAGLTFTKIDSTSNMEGITDQGGYDLFIKCSPLDSDNLIIGKVRCYYSTDGGNSFDFSSGIHADHHHFAVNPLVPERLYAATDGGMYYSDDFGATDTWVYMSEGLSITQYYRISVAQTDQHMVIGGSQDNGTHINYDSDPEYYRAYWNDGMDCAIHPTNDSLVILSSQNGDFELSVNGGKITTHLIDEDDIGEDASSTWVTPIAWDPIDSSNIYLGYKPIYTSNDFGATFNEIDDTVGGNIFLHVGTQNPNMLFAGDRYNNGAGTREFHIHRSIDASASWEPIHTNMDDSLRTKRKSYLTTNPDDSEEVWVTFTGFTKGIKVFRSTDGGDSWENESGSLPNIPVNCIIQQDTDNNPSGAVYIGTDIGVYYKNDNLEDWIYFSNDLPAVEVSDLDIKYSTNELYAGTYGRGIWSTPLYTECPDVHVLNSSTILPHKAFTFQAQDSILLHDYSLETVGSKLELNSGNLIRISEDFVANSEEGAILKATLGPCSGSSGALTTNLEEEGKQD